MKLYIKLYNGGFVSDIVEIKKSEYWTFYDVKKLICLGKNYKDFYHKTKTWIPTYHGTKYKYLESIVEYGLKIPGSKLPNGLKTQKPIYIPLNDNVSGIKNWESAILFHLV